MTKITEELRGELTGHIIPFWRGLRDDTRGGYAGYVGPDLTARFDADRGAIQTSRILWFFSEAYMLLCDPALLDEAEHAYEMLCRMTDEKNGGLYWSVHADGTPADGTKHTYCQAFGLYGLSAYFRASRREDAAARARALFTLMEAKCRDEAGYLESFTADWKPEDNGKLSGGGVLAERTMNTLLHVLEAYTGFWRASGDGAVRERLYEILRIWETRIWNPEKRRQEVFFDLAYRSLADVHSYGHDIEMSWLMEETLEALDDPALTRRLRPILAEMAEHVLTAGMSETGLANERAGGRIDERRCWWVQAEAMCGFLNAWEKTGDAGYRDAVLTEWRFIRDHLIDRRPGGEWFRTLSPDGTPYPEPAADPWKAPYHNGRMAMEFIRRDPEI